MVKRKAPGIEEFIPPDSHVDSARTVTLKKMERILGDINRSEEKARKYVVQVRMKMEEEKTKKVLPSRKRKNDDCGEKPHKRFKTGMNDKLTDAITNLTKVTKRKAKKYEELKKKKASKICVKKKDLEKKYYEAYSIERWASIAPIIFDRLFDVPKRLRNIITRTVTTDGVSASWHCKKSKQIPAKRQQDAEPKVIDRIPVSGQLGTHGVDCLLTSKALRNATVIAVDPGHASLISAVRLHKVMVPLKIPQRPTSRQMALLEKKQQLKMTSYELKNTTWRDMNGSRRLLDKIQSQFNQRGMKSAIELLAGTKRFTVDPRVYMDHINARLESSFKFIEIMSLRNKRRWKMEAYSTEQRAVEKLSTQLLEHASPQVIVVWGNGGFPPTSKGHASAPNKKLRRCLSRKMPILVVSEHNTSKRACCCTRAPLDLDNCRRSSYKRRTTVKKCPRCKTLLGRDMNAAVNISKMFLHQVRSSSKTLAPHLC